MKKWIILTAMVLFFLYPIISLLEMAFEGTPDISMFIRSVSFAVIWTLLYFYVLWTFSSKYFVLSWSIFAILIILAISYNFSKNSTPLTVEIAQAMEVIGWKKWIFETLYGMCVFVVAIAQGIEIQERRYQEERALKEKMEKEAFKIEMQRKIAEWNALPNKEKARRYEKRVRGHQAALTLSKLLFGEKVHHKELRKSAEIAIRDKLSEEKYL